MADAVHRTRPVDPPVTLRDVMRRVRHGIGAGLVVLLARGLMLLPRRVVVSMGRAVGRAAYFIFPRERRIAHANLDIVFGDTMMRARKRRIVRGAFTQFASTVFGLLWNPRLNASNINRWAVLSPQSEAFFRRARESGRGFILNVPHYGDWELLSLAMGFWGYSYMGVGADEDANRGVNGFVQRMRAQSGHVMVPPQNALLKLFKHLKRGGSVAMLADVNVPRSRGGIWVDFMGLPVFTSPAAAELALRTDAMIIFGYVKPLGDDRWELVVDGEVEPVRTGDHDADVRLTSQRLADRCAALIRNHPEPWLWTYRRWRRRPTPERGCFPFYSKYSDTGASKEAAGVAPQDEDVRPSVSPSAVATAPQT